jgi:DegV family protein with EDD domain
MASVIVTDSGNDLTRSETERLGISVVPIWINFDGGRYRDGIDIDRSAFFRRLQAGEVPKTEPPSATEYRDVFAKIVEAGNEVVHVSISSGISKCYENAVAGARDFGAKVAVVDSKGASGQQALLADYGAELAASGAGAAEIARKLDPKTLKAVTFFSVSDLEALSRSGRLPKALASLGSVLNVSLCLKINDQGAIGPAGQTFSFDKTIDLMLDAAIRAVGHAPSTRVAFGHVQAVDTAEKMRKDFESKLGHPPAKEMVHEVSLTLAANIGAGAVGLSVIVP